MGGIYILKPLIGFKLTNEIILWVGPWRYPITDRRFPFDISIGQCIKACVGSQNFIHKPENVLICSDSVAS